MTDSGPGMSSEDPWSQSLVALEELLKATRVLQLDYPSTLESLRSAMRSPKDEAAALLLLGWLDSDYTEALVGELVSASISHRHALRVRQILGRLSHEEAVQIVPPAVWHQLQETGDDDAYRRLAELLAHLGLHDALSQLSAQALMSSDPDIREVGEDFSGNPRPSGR